MLDQPQISRILKKSLYNGGQFAELFFSNTLETSIVFDDKRVEEIVSGADQGVGLRLIDNLKTVYGFTNNLDKNSLYDLATQLSHAIQGSTSDKDINFKKQEPNTIFPIKKDPLAIPTDQKVKLCERASLLAWSLDSQVSQVQICYNESKEQSQILNSLGDFIDQTQHHISLIVSITVNSGNDLFTSHDVISGICGYEIFDMNSVEELVKTTTKRALLNLKAKLAPGGKMPVILSSAAGGTIIHEAVGHGLEADLVHDGMSVYENKLGTQVASPLITIVDDATLPLKNGSFSFDDEGTPSQRTVLIEKGILKNYMCDRLTALKMNHKPTGNGRRESYEYRPIVRMTNTIMEPGNEDPQKILSSVQNGLFVNKMGGGQVNTVNGDFIFEVIEAYLIENGKIGEPVKNASLVGSGPDILNSIDMVGSDLGFSVGSCGKDDQSVSVSDAIPTIRIPDITVGGHVP